MCIRTADDLPPPWRIASSLDDVDDVWHPEPHQITVRACLCGPFVQVAHPSEPGQWLHQGMFEGPWRNLKNLQNVWRLHQNISKCINCNAVTATSNQSKPLNLPVLSCVMPVCSFRVLETNWYARYYYNEDTGETSICLKTYNSYQMFLTDAFSCTFALLLASCLVWLVLRFFTWYVLLRTASKPFKQEQVQRVGCHVFRVVHNSLFMAPSYPLSNFSFLR